MATRLHPGTALFAVPLAVSLAGCSLIGTPTNTAAAAPEGATVVEPRALTRADEGSLIDTDTPSWMDEITIDHRGRPVVLVVDETGALTVDRPPHGDVRRRETRRIATELRSGNGVDTIAVTPDGDVVVNGYAGDVLALSWIRTDGTVEVVPVQAALGPADARSVTTGLAPDGSALYVAYVDAVGVPQLLGVDPRTGVAVYRVAPGSAIPGRSVPAAIAVSESGDRVFVALDVETLGEDPRRTTTVHRMTRDLQSLGEVPLVPSREPSRTAQLVAGSNGTAYATLVVGDASTADVEIRLVALPPGAARVTAVASFPGLDDVRALAVDPMGTWAYLGGLAHAPDPMALTITPLDMRTGRVRSPVQLCARGELSDILLLGDRDGAWATGRCLDTQFTPELWTLH